MYNLEDIAVLIPAYNPDASLTELAEKLHENGFKIIVVNDGSEKTFSEIFEKTSKYADVVGYDTNQGKGAALKTGIKYIKENYGQLKGFITADADGQHSVKDILRVAEKMEETDGMVLGMRNLDKDIPFKSKFGNVLSKWVFGIVTGRVLVDNQAGLRGFSIRLCDWLLSIDGKYYEYEMHMLVRAVKDRVEIETLPIDTIYINNNSTSHFKPIKDTCRIQGSLIKNGILSIVLYAVLIAFLSVGLLSGLEWFIVLPVIVVILIAHVLMLKNRMNAIVLISILTKYLITFFLIKGMCCDLNLIAAGIIISIALVVFTSYLFASINTQSGGRLFSRQENPEIDGK